METGRSGGRRRFRRQLHGGPGHSDFGWVGRGWGWRSRLPRAYIDFGIASTGRAAGGSDRVDLNGVGGRSDGKDSWDRAGKALTTGYTEEHGENPEFPPCPSVYPVVKGFRTVRVMRFTSSGDEYHRQL